MYSYFGQKRIVKVVDFRFNTITPNSLIKGDCLEVMRSIEDDFIDIVITDPPYGFSKTPDIVEILSHWVRGEYISPEGKGFMGKEWDSFVPSPKIWKEVYRILKPGGISLVFAGSRTQDLLSISLRFAGFEIRDTMMWLYGQGFPKSLNISKAIDRKKGSVRKVKGVSRTFDGDLLLTAPEAELWEGWETGLKPAYEPIIIAMKPVDKNFVNNALRHGVAGLWIAGSRIPTSESTVRKVGESSYQRQGRIITGGIIKDTKELKNEYSGSGSGGRFPSNVIFQHHPDCELEGTKKVRSDDPCISPTNKGLSLKNNGRDEKNKLAEDSKETIEKLKCHSECPVRLLNAQSGVLISGKNSIRRKPALNSYNGGDTGAFAPGAQMVSYPDSGYASRFFYTAKASKKERNFGLPEGEINTHPTVKPLKIMEYLCKLTKTPTSGIVLDPFMGSGTTGLACKNTGRDFIGIEKESEYFEIAKKRLFVKSKTRRRPEIKRN